MSRSRGSRAASCIVAALAGSLTLPAHASDASLRAEAMRQFEQAERARDELRFEDALREYRASFEADPSAPVAGRARARERDLAAHAEGGFAPLRMLEPIRRNPLKNRDPSALAELERELETFPEGRVRAEARLVVAEGYWHGLGAPARAIRPLERVLDDPAADALARSIALNELVALHRESGSLDRASELLDRFPDLAPSLRTTIHRIARRATIGFAAELLLAVVATLGLVAAATIARREGVRALPRRTIGRLSIGFSLYLGAFGALLAKAHGEADPRPFLWLGLGVLAIDTAARAVRQASAARVVRAFIAVLCVTAVFALGLTVLRRSHPGYLDAFGL